MRWCCQRLLLFGLVLLLYQTPCLPVGGGSGAQDCWGAAEGEGEEVVVGIHLPVLKGVVLLEGLKTEVTELH